MSFDSVISFISPIIVTAVALYFSLLITRLNGKVKKNLVINVWIAISLFYITIPYFNTLAFVFVDIPYSIFLIPAIAVFFIAKYYWKLKSDKALIFALCYGFVNLVTVMALGFLLSGVFQSPSPSPTTYLSF